MSEFKREGRYIVVKPDYEDSLRTERLRNYIDEMCFHTPDCVVVEADWPEYEPVWRMIERRVTGDSSNERPVEVLGYSVVGNRYAIRLTKGEVLELSENYADHLIELVDRKHLTDAQVELAALREELARLNRVKFALAEQVQVHSDNCSVYRVRLAAAEQRNANLETDLKVTKQALQSLKGERADSDLRVMDLLARASQCGGLTEDWHEAVAALKPTESGASEPQCCDRFPKCVCHEGADGL